LAKLRRTPCKILGKVLAYVREPHIAGGLAICGSPGMPDSHDAATLPRNLVGEKLSRAKNKRVKFVWSVWVLQGGSVAHRSPGHRRKSAEFGSKLADARPAPRLMTGTSMSGRRLL
jgi:hypothetical protein